MLISICQRKSHDLKTVVNILEELLDRQCIEARIYSYSSSQDLLADAEKIMFDIIFLDICLSDGNGLNISKSLLKLNPYSCIIFITDCKKYALEAYAVGALHYIVRPFCAMDIETAIKRCLMRKFTSDDGKLIRIMVERNDVVINQSCIRYIEVRAKKLIINTAYGEYQTWMPLYKLEQELDKQKFVKLQRSYIVNMGYIVRLSGGICTLRDGTDIQLSRHSSVQIKNAYKDYLFAVQGKSPVF